MKDLSILARAARTLLIVMLLTMTAQTALAQTTLTLDPNHSGSTGCIIIPIEYGLNGYSYSLTNFNPANYPQFVRDGFTILSWNTSPTGGGTGYGANETVVLTVNQNLTLYAIWANNSCNVTFISNGGTGTMEAVQVTGGTEYIIPANGFSRDGYLFLGWTTTANGSIVYRPGDKVTLTDDLTLYAVWGTEWSGSGTVDNPYQISEYTDLLLLAQRVNGGTDYSGKYFKLMNDITFPHTTNWNAATSTENNFTAIGFAKENIGTRPFNGTFDGDGHTISGIRIYKGGNTDGDKQQGLFGCIKGGTVKNLTLADARITGFENVGGIVGYYEGTIENCHVRSNVAIHAVVSGAINHGGIVGYNDIVGTVNHCSSAATLSLGSSASDSFYGGIVGLSYGALCDNLAIGVTIPAVDYCGAIAGYCGNLQRNYYSGCTVGDATSNIGCYGGDITANDGAVSAVILSESAAVPSPLSGKVVFRREFKENVSSTICLPFGIDATQAAAAGKFFTFVGVDKTNPNDWIVTMQETAGNNMVEGALTANTPYLFKPAATGPVLFYGTAAATATAGKTPSSGHTGGWVFQGTYERINWPTDPQTIYGFAAPGKADLAEGKFFRVKGGSNSYILPFRAYLDAANGGASARGRRTPAESDLPDVMTVRLLSANGTPTAIGTLDTRTGEVRFDSDAWYSLDGRRLDGKPTKKGMYINKERKIIIK